VGGFEGRHAGTQIPSTTRQAVGVSGFGDTAVEARSATPGTIARAGSGFNDMRAASAQPSVRAQVSSTRFDSVEAQPSADRPERPATKGPSMGIEILEKPRPEYTDEARRLHIEGDVLIQALFAASGQVRVLRIVRGLGHGLDENAVTAAGGIRFRPAMQGGQATDTVVVLRIQFQLLY
jgi:TonB family protein